MTTAILESTPAQINCWVDAFLPAIRKHISYVQIAGKSIGVTEWQLRIHDESKFSSHELPFYARQFEGDKGDPVGFAKAWLHHQNANPHHWEYWITRSDHSHGGSGSEDGCLEMPECYVLEMVADWMGASKAYTGSFDMTDWLARNLPGMRIHSASRQLLADILKEQGYLATQERYND